MHANNMSMKNKWEIIRLVKNGRYLRAYVPSHPNANKHGYVLAHRIVAENKEGRILSAKEHVHHINGDGHDNRPENLQVLSASAHTSLHAREVFKKTYIYFKCNTCNCDMKIRSNQPHRLAAKRHFCSRKCMGLGYKGISKTAK